MSDRNFFLKIVFGAALLSLLFTTTAVAQNSTLQPISTRFAQTQTKISLDIMGKRFSDVELDEADQFDGYTAVFDLTVPFAVDKQVRLSVPFYTSGDARLKPGGQPIHIEGKGGVFDYATLELEYQKYFAEDVGYNLAYTIGAGMRTATLDTGTGDLYNHTGRIIVLGTKMDKSVHGGEIQLLLNAGIRFYFDADDLHPNGWDDWLWADIKGAVVFKPWGKYVRPVLELTYLGGFHDYNAVALMPELIVQVTEAISFKPGGIIGLTSDGNQAGITGELALNF